MFGGSWGWGWGRSCGPGAAQDTGQLQDFQKESQLGPSVDGVEETRGLEPYQGTFGMNARM